MEAFSASNEKIESNMARVWYETGKMEHRDKGKDGDQCMWRWKLRNLTLVDVVVGAFEAKVVCHGVEFE